MRTIGLLLLFTISAAANAVSYSCFRDYSMDAFSMDNVANPNWTAGATVPLSFKLIAADGTDLGTIDTTATVDQFNASRSPSVTFSHFSNRRITDRTLTLRFGSGWSGAINYLHVDGKLHSSECLWGH